MKATFSPVNKAGRGFYMSGIVEEPAAYLRDKYIDRKLYCHCHMYNENVKGLTSQCIIPKYNLK